MSIVNLKSKVVSLNNNQNNEKSITKKFEVISSNFKSTPTILSRDLQIEGDISSSGIIEIEGSIKGNIKGNSVILRENGIIDGNLVAESVSLRGSFNGIIKAKNISISGKAKVFGEIEYESLCVEDGACIDGQFKWVKQQS